MGKREVRRRNLRVSEKERERERGGGGGGGGGGGVRDLAGEKSRGVI